MVKMLKLMIKRGVHDGQQGQKGKKNKYCEQVSNYLTDKMTLSLYKKKLPLSFESSALIYLGYFEKNLKSVSVIIH